LRDGPNIINQAGDAPRRPLAAMRVVERLLQEASFSCNVFATKQKNCSGKQGDCMAIACPRCGGPVSRAYSASAQMAGGLVAALFYGAFGALQCKKCGKIPRSEFPSEVQTRLALTTTAMVVGAVALLILCIALFSK
jgi:hypothetical protein